MTNGPARFGERRHLAVIVVLDCADLDRSARFWCGVLGYVAEPGSSGRYRRLTPVDGTGFELLLQQVSDAKTTKNRMHLDLRVADLEDELARVLAFGARCITDHPVEEDGWIWHVLADPDGNEFCVLRPPSAGAG